MTALTLIEGDRSAVKSESNGLAEEKTELASPVSVVDDGTDPNNDSDDNNTPNSDQEVIVTATAQPMSAQEVLDQAMARGKEIERDLEEKLNAIAQQYGLSSS